MTAFGLISGLYQFHFSIYGILTASSASAPEQYTGLWEKSYNFTGIVVALTLLELLMWVT